MHEDILKIIARSEYYSDIITEYERLANKQIAKDERQLQKLLVVSIEKILKEHSAETNNHAKNVIDLTRRFGLSLDLDLAEIKTLVLIARFHDIGKINISSKILNKPDKLNEEEWKQIKLHSTYSYEILNQIEEYKHIANDVLCHHERFDGTGYPNGLKGKDIPIYSRIISVLDTYEVLINGRVYKPAVSKLDAIAEIKRCSGTQFDPSVVKIFLEVCVKVGVITKTESLTE